jgi:hypothetical protein
MKKLIIITAIMLLAVAAFAQQNTRERERAKTQNHKSEATVRRSAERNPNTTTQRTRRVNNENTQRATRSTESRTRVYSDRTQNSNRGKRPSGVSNHRRDVHQKPSGLRNQTGGNKQKPEGVNRNPGGKTNKPAGTRYQSGNNKHNPAAGRKNYTTPNRRHVRKAHAVHTHYKPAKYRKVHHHHYRAPRHVNVVWTPRMYREYRVLYPDFHYWYYPTGYRIVTVPFYSAHYHIGEVRNVYGRVHQVWYSWQTDEYYLYFGGTYPYQDFTVILEGRDARRFARYPETYFSGRYIWVTGLVSTFEGKPEILVRRRSQIHLY